MDVAIIGGGFTGLTAAYTLAKAGHRVTVFEKDTVLGGLAHGFKRPTWDWYLEYAYHHLFANDWAIISLIKELGLESNLLLTRPITANYTQGNIIQLDSPRHLLSFPYLSPIDKLRTAALLAFCKIYPDRIGGYPFWQPLEGITANELFKAVGGDAAWNVIWEPLMIGKFGEYADTIAASWLWARIKKRTPNLYYIAGGFHTVVEALSKAIINYGGIIYTNTAVTSIKKVSGDRYYVVGKKTKQQFKRVLLTVPTPLAVKLFSQPLIPTTSTQSPLNIPHLHAQTLILETKEPILKDIYWLNITDRTFPFLAVVAHTNMVNKKHYGGHHLTYFGNYLPKDHPYLSMTKQQIIKVFLPYIQRLRQNSEFRIQNIASKNQNSKFQILNSDLFVGPFAQPVHQLSYSQRAPKLQTPLKGVYLANLDSIYPWDRGTNYAVELGIRAAHTLSSRA